MPTSLGIFDVGSIVFADTVTALVCLFAAWLCFRCATRPLYHSSASLARGDRRFWACLAIGLALAAAIEFVGGYVVVWVIWRNLLDALDAHPAAVEIAFYSALVAATVFSLLVLRWAVVGSARRNWFAVIGATVVVVAFVWRVYLMQRQVFTGGFAEPIWLAAELHLIGVIVGAIGIAASAYQYIREQRRQSNWRENLTQSSLLIRHVKRKDQRRKKKHPAYRPSLRF